jgi:acetyltransferase-like isoleucine patch superfamily enzyme
MQKIYRRLRYSWPLHFILLFTNWLPDESFCLRLRGALARPFIGRCGRDLRLGRNVTLYEAESIELGDHVYLAYGCVLMANSPIVIEDEVMIGPYSVVSAGNHTRIGTSFRYGPPQLAPIRIGRGSWLATHVVITAGTTIEEGCLIAGGSVVRGHVSANTAAGGVPAKTLKVLDASEA